MAIGSLAFSILASSAHADWRETSSDHFVIYADEDEKDLRRFAERLERFHAAMAYRLRMAEGELKPSPSNRVTIYVVSSRSKVRKLADSTSRSLAGFYLPRAGATVAVIPKLDRRSSAYELSSETILFHEYAHHFMASLTARVFPRWFMEGFAEFFAAAKFPPEGGVGLGQPAFHRAYELAYGRALPLRRMLEFDGGLGGAKSGTETFYGRSWLLFHYLMFATERSGQLQDYQALLAKGRPALEAATGAFGDLDQLEKDLEHYQRSTAFKYMLIPDSALGIGPVSVRALRPGEADMMPTRMQSRLGVTPEEALELLPEAHRIAGLHPDDSMVLAALAEAEFDAGNDDAAIAASDRAIAINPGEIDAHIQKGYALYRKVKNGDLPKESWKEVRSQFVRANRIENDHPIPLIRFYLCFLEQGEAPTKVSVQGLEWAMILAPFDAGLRWMVAQQMIFEDRLEDAARTLGPLAYSPHPGEHTDKALQLLKDVEARIQGEPKRESD